MPRGLDSQPQQPASRRRRQPALTTPRADAPPVQLLQHPRQPPAAAAAAATAGTQSPAPQSPASRLPGPVRPGCRDAGRHPPPRSRRRHQSRQRGFVAALRQPCTSHGQEPQPPQNAQRPRPQLRQRPPPLLHPQSGLAAPQAPQSICQSGSCRRPGPSVGCPCSTAAAAGTAEARAAEHRRRQVRCPGASLGGAGSCEQRGQHDLILSKAVHASSHC